MREKAGGMPPGRGEKINYFNVGRPPRTTAGPPKRLEADRERTGASDLCEARKP